MDSNSLNRATSWAWQKHITGSALLPSGEMFLLKRSLRWTLWVILTLFLGWRWRPRISGRFLLVRAGVTMDMNLETKTTDRKDEIILIHSRSKVYYSQLMFNKNSCLFKLLVQKRCSQTGFISSGLVLAETQTERETNLKVSRVELHLLLSVRFGWFSTEHQLKHQNTNSPWHQLQTSSTLNGHTETFHV